SSGMPSTSVYLVLPARIALIAASLMLSGVSKSGSPAPSPMTLRPWALSARARSVTATVADGFTRESVSARKAIGLLRNGFLRRAGAGGVARNALTGKAAAESAQVGRF